MFLVLITKIKKIRSFFSIFIYLKNIRIFINNKYWITLFVKLEIGQFVFLFFLSLLFFFSFSFIIIIDYRINPFTNIWNVAFCAERLNTGGKNEKKMVYVLIPFISMLWNSFVNECASYLFVSNSFGDAVYEIFQKASDVLNLTLRLWLYMTL